VQLLHNAAVSGVPARLSRPTWEPRGAPDGSCSAADILRPFVVVVVVVVVVVIVAVPIFDCDNDNDNEEKRYRNMSVGPLGLRSLRNAAYFAYDQC